MLSERKGLDNLTEVHSKWFCRRAIAIHITAIVLITAFVLLGRWQLHRALSGNGLSWAYTFEWPIFGLYAIYVWWKLINEIVFDRPASTDGMKADSVKQKNQEEQRVAYNDYLAQLHQESSGTDH